MAEPAGPDPVLVQLAEWASRRGFGREAVARELGVKRPTVAGWFLGLEAAAEGRPAPRSAREFRFGNQRPEVQARIAALLGLPLRKLREDSLGREADPPQGETGDVARALIGDLATAGIAQPSSLTGAGSDRHRIAELVEGVDGVTATTVIAVERGRLRAVPYQYQVVVHAAPSSCQEPGDVDDIRARIDAVLNAESLPCRWEHGAQRPTVDVTTRGAHLVYVGSLICASLSGSRAPRSGTLLSSSADHAPSVRDLRTAAVVTNPYGGSGPVAGMLARALGVGHLRSDEIVRAVRAAQSRHGPTGERGPFLSAAATHDAGYILQMTLYLLEHREVPGAWVLSFEAQSLDYAPMRDAVADMDGLCIVVRLGPQWRRIAGWRLAAAELNAGARSTGPADAPLSSDWIDMSPGRNLTDAEQTVLRAQAAAAADRIEGLDRGEGMLEDLVRRRANTGRPTVAVTLADVPDDLRVSEVKDGRLQPRHGDGRFAGPLAASDDDVDRMLDAWADATARILDELTALAGRESRDDIFRDRHDPVAEMLSVDR